MTSQPFVLCDNLVKIYKIADLEVVALQGLDLAVEEGEMVALVGASGSGKSTLLNVIGGLDTPSAGAISVGGQDLLQLRQRGRVRYKRNTVGFLWQQPSRNLLPYLSARENVAVPMMAANRSARERARRADALLDSVGLADRADFRPDQLSGGQQQRVALAVALANNPPLLLADEPTGQVDAAAAQVFSALRRINEEYGTTIIVVTHDPRVAAQVDRVVGIRDGRTSTEIRRRRNGDGAPGGEEEWVILDQAGRLQLPQPYVEALRLRGRVKARLEADHVSLWPALVEELSDDGNSQSPPATWRPPAQWYNPVPGSAAVTVTALSRVFDSGAGAVRALDNVSLEIPAGKLVVIKGPSGSGKTTLLNLIAGLDEPTAGDVVVGERQLSAMGEQERIGLRRRHIGFVFQTFGLLPFLSARENVEVPLRLLALPRGERRERVDEALAVVGLAERAGHRTYELSGGEQQRVAIARALVNRPTLILADEPTGQLDSATGASIIALLRRIVEATGITAIVASHDPKVEEAAHLVYHLEDGRLVAPHPAPAAATM